MVEVTIETDLKNQNPNEKRVRKMSPCNLAFVVCITHKEGEEGYHNNVSIVGGQGLNMFHVSESIAGCTVKTLIEFVGDSETRQAFILASYMKEFVDAVTKMTGTAVMEEVTKMVMGKE